MELIRGIHNLRAHHRGCVATIGAFDGVHRGHQIVLNSLIAKARALGLPATVIVFEPLPREYFAGLTAPPRLMSFREKFAQLRALGIDRVLRIHFDARFSHMSSQDFIKKVFVDGLGIQYLVVGDDLRFGHDREGDYELLKAAGQEYGFEVQNTNTLEIDGARASSTRIREALEHADFEAAEAMLGRPYTITGRVMVGQQLGRTLGFPTANLQLYRLRSPLMGVYAVRVHGAADHPVPAVANVGMRPTIGDLPKAILEVHLLEYSANLYSRTIEVEFHQKLRDEQKFGSIDQLKAQIQKDVGAARRYFGLPAADNTLDQA